MAYVDRRKVVIFGLSTILLVVVVLGLLFGCSTCTIINRSELNRLRDIELQWMEFLEAERLAAEAAALAEQERLAAEAERARLEAERLEAERLANEARRRAQANAASSQQNTQGLRSTESNANNPFVGIWANDNQAIVFRFRDGGTLEVLNYTLVDEFVDVKFVTNRALEGGGYNTYSNPAASESTYTGTGTYTVNKDSVSFVLNMKNNQGAEKTVKHTTKFNINDARNALQLTRGLARKYVINRNTRGEVEDKRSDFVNKFTRR